MKSYVTVSGVLDDLPHPDDDHNYPNHVGRNHRPSTKESYGALDFGEVPNEGFSPRRLYPDRPSFTLTCSQGKTPIHYDDSRMLTAREAARLQTFPDTFVVSGDGRITCLRHLNNTVPPTLVQSIATRLPE